MRRALIEEQNGYLLKRQHEFRLAADVVAAAWIEFEEVQAVAVIRSVAKPLWKEVPRFREFRREGIEVWHECGDLDLALWLTSQHRLDDIRRATAKALRDAFEAGIGVSIVPQQLDLFMFEPETDRYLGRLCNFSVCPRGKLDCLVPGCGEIPFNKRVTGSSRIKTFLRPQPIRCCCSARPVCGDPRSICLPRLPRIRRTTRTGRSDNRAGDPDRSHASRT